MHYVCTPARHEARGQAIVEYALILLLISLTVVTALSTIGPLVASLLSQVEAGF